MGQVLALVRDDDGATIEETLDDSVTVATIMRAIARYEAQAQYWQDYADYLKPFVRAKIEAAGRKSMSIPGFVAKLYANVDILCGCCGKDARRCEAVKKGEPVEFVVRRDLPSYVHVTRVGQDGD